MHPFRMQRTGFTTNMECKWIELSEDRQMVDAYPYYFEGVMIEYIQIPARGWIQYNNDV